MWIIRPPANSHRVLPYRISNAIFFRLIFCDIEISRFQRYRSRKERVKGETLACLASIDHPMVRRLSWIWIMNILARSACRMILIQILERQSYGRHMVSHLWRTDRICFLYLEVVASATLQILRPVINYYYEEEHYYIFFSFFILSRFLFSLSLVFLLPALLPFSPYIFFSNPLSASPNFFKKELLQKFLHSFSPLFLSFSLSKYIFKSYRS